jgi:hypothetical protein
MGCLRCGRRQVDPDSGPSTWRRAVVAGEQVLVCPDCQVEGWTDGLDRCRACGSAALVKRLGEVSCRACGASGGAVSGPAAGERPVASPVTSEARAALAEDVAAALDRVLRGEG